MHCVNDGCSQNRCTGLCVCVCVFRTTGRSSRWAPGWCSWPRLHCHCSRAAQNAAVVPFPCSTCRSERTCWCCSCRCWQTDTSRHMTRCSPARGQQGIKKEQENLMKVEGTLCKRTNVSIMEDLLTEKRKEGLFSIHPSDALWLSYLSQSPDFCSHQITCSLFADYPPTMFIPADLLLLVGNISVVSFLCFPVFEL